MPVFTVIAGPNGAGKSTFSSLLSRPDALIFDPDLQKQRIEKQFPDISDDALETAVTRAFDHFQMKALGTNLHLTVETNLRNEFLLESVDLFKKAEYETRLIFMLLPDIAASLDRVDFRIKQKGHYVDAESIRLNFEQGQVNLLKMANHFDHVMLVSGFNQNPEVKTEPGLLLSIKDGTVVQKAGPFPDWCSGIIESIEAIVTNRQRHTRRNR